MEKELKQLLRDRAEEMRLPPDIPRPVLRRARRHRRVTGALAGVATIALVAVGFVGIRAALDQRTEVRTPVGPPTIEPTPSPSVTTEPTPSPSPTEATLGFPFPVCDVTWVQGHFRDVDTLGTAYVATRKGDVGECPQVGFTMIGMDLDGDGEVDASHGPIECYPINCLAFAAPDLDGNGTSELAVVQQHGSVLGLQFYALGEGGVEIIPVVVAPPGDPEGGFEPGEQPLIWASGGDGFNHNALRCEDEPGGRTLVAISAVQDPPDRVESVWKAHETTFQLRAGGELHVIDTRDFEEPRTSGRPEFDSEDQLCGLEP